MEKEQVLQKFVNNCQKGKHELIKIYESGGDSESDVIRWCQICGAVVGDVDYDTRTQPGRMMPMMAPEILKVIEKDRLISHVEKTKCIHRITPEDVPRGLDAKDSALPCDQDGECPELYC